MIKWGSYLSVIPVIHLKRDKADNLSSVIPRETRYHVRQTRYSEFLTEWQTRERSRLKSMANPLTAYPPKSKIMIPETVAPWFPFFVALGALLFTHRLTTRVIHHLSFRLTHSLSVCLYTYALITWPGTVVHEFSHWLMAILLRGSSGICSKHDANSSDETSLSRG